MGIWNRIKSVDEVNELLSQHGTAVLDGYSPSSLSGNSPALDNAIPNTPAANPSLRRLASPEGGFGGDDKNKPTKRKPLAKPPAKPGQKPLVDPKTVGAVPATVPFMDRAKEFTDWRAGGGQFDPTRQYGRTEEDMEGVPDGGMGPTEADPSTESNPPSYTGSRWALERYNQERGRSPDVSASRRKSWWNRAWDGARNAYKNWEPGPGSGGIVGLGVNIAGNAVEKGVSPNEHAVMAQNRNLSKIWNRYGQAMQVEQAEMNRLGEIAKTNKLSTEALQARYKQLSEGFGRDDRFTDEEAAILTALGIPSMPYDASTREEKDINGKAYTRRTKGGGAYVRDVSLPEDLGKTRTDTKIQTAQGDVTLPLTPSEAAHTLVSAAERAERAAERVQKREDEQKEKVYKNRKEYQDDLRSWSKEDVKMQGQKSKAMKSLESLRASRADLVAGQYNTDAIDRQIADLEGQIAEADVWIANRHKTKPIYTSAPGESQKKGGKKKFTNSDIDRVIQGK